MIIIRRVILIVLIVLLFGCASDTAQRIYQTNPETEISWPTSPDRTRVRYLYSFSNYKDLDLRLPLSKRFSTFLAGDDVSLMVRPYAVAVDIGLFAVADPGLGAVHLFDTHRNLYRTIDSINGVNLNSPIGVSLSKNRIFIADSALDQVHILSRSLNRISTISDLNRPTSLAWDPTSQRLFISETHAHRIKVYDKEGNHLLNIGTRGNGPAEFNFPTHIAVHNGQVFVNDTMNFRVQMLDADGNFLRGFGRHGDSPGFIAQPKGIAVDSQDNVYVAESLSNTIQVFNTEGRFLMNFGESGASPGTFSMPAGLTIFKDKLYVCDSRNSRIQVFEYLREE